MNTGLYEVPNICQCKVSTKFDSYRLKRKEKKTIKDVQPLRFLSSADRSGI